MDITPKYKWKDKRAQSPTPMLGSREDTRRDHRYYPKIFSPELVSFMRRYAHSNVDLIILQIRIIGGKNKPAIRGMWLVLQKLNVLVEPV